MNRIPNLIPVPCPNLRFIIGCCFYGSGPLPDLRDLNLKDFKLKTALPETKVSGRHRLMLFTFCYRNRHYFYIYTQKKQYIQKRED